MHCVATVAPPSPPLARQCLSLLGKKRRPYCVQDASPIGFVSRHDQAVEAVDLLREGLFEHGTRRSRTTVSARQGKRRRALLTCQCGRRAGPRDSC